MTTSALRLQNPVPWVRRRRTESQFTRCPSTPRDAGSSVRAVETEKKTTITPATPIERINMNGKKSRPEIGEHTSELQSRQYLVCRLLLEKKKKKKDRYLKRT